ncbi:MAG: SPASM domain-containing protein [Eubacterium sp.]|nr:SPASM domain-containing protein [Eubacterium sp.]
MIRVSAYGGKPGWYLKKIFPKLSASMFLKMGFTLRRKRTSDYINWFMEQPSTPHPLIIAIETINRCNNTCSFCPANKNSEKRPYARMSDEDFYKIIDDLKEWNYQGYLSLFVNNEPFIDTRIIEFHKYVKKELPDCKIKLFTNGLLMTLDKFLEIKPYVDVMTINNYSEDMTLLPNVEAVKQYVQEHPSDFEDIEIKINIRYIKDILTNRNGTAPNKEVSRKEVKEPCLFPYTDMFVYANGNVGLCCNDALEKTNLGNIREEKISNIWKNNAYNEIRKAMAKNRSGYPFCKYCDFIDTGLRVKTSTSTLKETK